MPFTSGRLRRYAAQSSLPRAERRARASWHSVTRFFTGSPSGRSCTRSQVRSATWRAVSGVAWLQSRSTSFSSNPTTCSAGSPAGILGRGSFVISRQVLAAISSLLRSSPESTPGRLTRRAHSVSAHQARPAAVLHQHPHANAVEAADPPAAAAVDDPAEGCLAVAELPPPDREPRPADAGPVTATHGDPDAAAGAQMAPPVQLPAGADPQREPGPGPAAEWVG